MSMSAEEQFQVESTLVQMGVYHNSQTRPRCIDRVASSGDHVSFCGHCAATCGINVVVCGEHVFVCAKQMQNRFWRDSSMTWKCTCPEGVCA